MSQKKEKYARDIGRRMDSYAAVMMCMQSEIDTLKHFADFSIFSTGCDSRQIDRLQNRVEALEREQRRRQVSRERIALLSSTAAVCTALIWVSLMIFRLV